MFEIGKVDSKLCNFCQNEVETIRHLMFNCPAVQKLLINFINLYQTKNIDIELKKLNYNDSDLRRWTSQQISVFKVLVFRRH